MNTVLSGNWFDSNQRYLSQALEFVRSRLEARANSESAKTPEQTSSPVADDSQSPPPALVSLCAAFKLSPFERDILILCAGIELDSRFGTLCAQIQNDPVKTFPTFSLALASLDDPHWSALSPAGPLRYWRLVELVPGNIGTQSQLRIDERVLHFLTGTSYTDERLIGYVKHVAAEKELVPSHDSLAQKLAQVWSQHSKQGPLPIIQLCGNETASKRDVAAHACMMLGMNLNIMPERFIPSDPLESESLRRLWQRECVLSSSVLMLDCEEGDNEPSQNAIVRQWIDNADYPLIISTRERKPMGLRRTVSFEIGRPTTSEQHQLWKGALGSTAVQLNGRVEALVSHFNLDAHAINSIATDALQTQTTDTDELGRVLWDACSAHAHPQLGELAQRIQPMANWDDLVLPDIQIQTLHDVASQIRQRLKVYETWGFASKSTRGLGISALFAGVSGTGKTMAAEVLVNELGVDLYRIDLSQVISKYIGETEKNLRRVFDAAEESSAILLFDEADALFGKRSEVKDSHDRYANVEVSYLLQRMEAYRGLAILTTNMKDALDQAFLRRIRFVVQFPFPDVSQRTEIWKRVFPSQTPTENLHVNSLAKLNITGGNIRNIALYAAFLAADSNEPVGMDHLLRAARAEFSKLEKPLTESEIGGWA